jgi:acyl carrier protein
MEIKEFIEKIEREFDLPSGSLKPETDYKLSVNWSSINAVVLATLIEFECNTLLSTEDFKQSQTIADLHIYIINKKKL